MSIKRFFILCINFQLLENKRK